MDKNKYWKAYSEETRSHDTMQLDLMLEELSESQLVELIVGSLTESINIQRILNESIRIQWVQNDWGPQIEENFDFYHATMWHLTDSLVFMPETLITDGRFPPYIENQSKATRLCQYYSFLLAFLKLAPEELLNRVQLNNTDYLKLIKTEQLQK